MPFVSDPSHYRFPWLYRFFTHNISVAALTFVAKLNIPARFVTSTFFITYSDNCNSNNRTTNSCNSNHKSSNNANNMLLLCQNNAMTSNKSELGKKKMDSKRNRGKGRTRKLKQTTVTTTTPTATATRITILFMARTCHSDM